MQSSLFISIKRAIKQGIQQLIRHRFLSLSTYAIGVLILFLLDIMIALYSYTNLQIRDLHRRADVLLILENDYDTFELQSLINELAPYEVNTTILPETSIQFIKLDTVEDVFTALKKTRYDSVLGVWDSSMENSFTTTINRAFTLQKTIERISFGAIIFFILGGIILIQNMVRISLFDRRKELSIGAEFMTLARPYYIESIILSLLISFTATALFTLFLTQIPLRGMAEVFEVFGNNIFLWQIIATIILSLIATFFAVHKYFYRSVEA